MALPVLVINRAVDTDRLNAFRQSAGRARIEPVRIDALDAHQPDFPFQDHADLLRDRFWDSDRIKPGAIGCFLSHRRAWRHVVDSGRTMALICEDDAEFTAEFLVAPERLETIAQATPDADVIFANGRMAAWSAAHSAADVKPLQHILSDLAGSGGPKARDLKPTPGGDCYLISLSGAKALLERTDRQGIVCGVDWAMVWNGVGPVSASVASAFPELKTLARSVAPPEPLNIFALSTPIADQRGGPSVLGHSVTVPIAELR